MLECPIPIHPGGGMGGGDRAMGPEAQLLISRSSQLFCAPFQRSEFMSGPAEKTARRQKRVDAVKNMNAVAAAMGVATIRVRADAEELPDFFGELFNQAQGAQKRDLSLGSRQAYSLFCKSCREARWPQDSRSQGHCRPNASAWRAWQSIRDIIPYEISGLRCEWGLCVTRVTHV